MATDLHRIDGLVRYDFLHDLHQLLLRLRQIITRTPGIGLRQWQRSHRRAIRLPMHVDRHLLDRHKHRRHHVRRQREHEAQGPQQRLLLRFIPGRVLVRRELDVRHQQITAADRHHHLEQRTFGGGENAGLDVLQIGPHAADLHLGVARNATAVHQRSVAAEGADVACAIDDALVPRVADELGAAQFFVVEVAVGEAGPTDHDFPGCALRDERKVAVHDVDEVVG